MAQTDKGAALMPQDAYTLNFVAKELSERLTGGKISRVTQSDRDTLTFIIYTLSGNVKLDICVSARACRASLTDIDKPCPDRPPAFCMLLRKHLQNAEILSVTQLPFERIIVFTLRCSSEFEVCEMKLYAEIMGKYSNVVLTKDGIIAGALKTAPLGENTRRVLFPGAAYTLPEPQEKIPPDDMEELEKILSLPTPDRAGQIFENVKGVAYSTALDIVDKYGENPTANDVNSYICGGQSSPCVTLKDGVEDDFKARSESAEVIPFDNILDAQKEFYDKLFIRQTFGAAANKLKSQIDSKVKAVTKRLEIIDKKLFDCRDAETVKLKGELVTANIYALKKGMDGFEAINYYDENGGKIKIALDRTLTPAQNAQKYYARYAKLRRTQKIVSEQKKEAAAELDYLESALVHLNNAENLSDLFEAEEEFGLKTPDRKKKKALPPPFRRYEIGGFTVLAGRNNVQNDRLLKSLSSEDIWLHTQKYHSSHVAVLCGGRDAPERVILAAAEICAYYSAARGGAKVPVDYTRKKFVKKPPKSAAGFVIYTNFKTLSVNPDGHFKESAEEQ